MMFRYSTAIIIDMRLETSQSFDYARCLMAHHIYRDGLLAKTDELV